MLLVLQRKFDQHPELKEDLLDTGEKELILVCDQRIILSLSSQHYILQASKDDLWGAGDDGTGENNFGKALMILRSQILESL